MTFPAFQQSLRLGVLSGGRKLDAPDVLLGVDVLHAPLPALVGEWSDRPDDTKVGFQPAHQIHDTNRLASLKRLPSLNARPVTVQDDSPGVGDESDAPRIL